MSDLQPPPIAPHVTDDELSAYLDAELAAPARQQVTAHLAVCPCCADRLSAFADLAADLGCLPSVAPEVDLTGVILGRLPPVVSPSRPTLWAGWRALLPVGIGATASVALGLALGAALFGTGAALPGVAAMQVFDPLPPGSLCLGVDSCYTRHANLTGVIR